MPRNGKPAAGAAVERFAASAAEIDAVVTLLAETRMDGVGYSIVRLEPPFCVAGRSGPLTLCYLVRKGRVWLELDAAPERIVELAPGSVVGTSGIFAHWFKSSPRLSTHGVRPLSLLPLGPPAAAPRGVEILVGHAPIESLSVMLGTPGAVVIAPNPADPIWQRIRLAMEQIEAELTDPHPMGGIAAAVRRYSELILLNISRHIVAESSNDDVQIFNRPDFRIMRATAAASRGPLADWTVGKLANVAGMSRSTFAERFRVLTGQSPMRAITQMRLRIAASELAHGYRPVGDIADAAGFGSTAAFTRAFTRYFGVTPARWRATRTS